MRWIWSRWRRRPADNEAAAWRRESERRLAEVQRLEPAVRLVADQLAAAAEQNNFAAMVAAAFGRR